MAFKTKATAVRHQTNYFYEGKMIVLTKQVGKPKKRMDKLVHQSTHKRGWWPEAKRIEAATVFAVTRHFDRTAALVGVPSCTIKKWNEEAWFHEIIAKVKKDKNDALDGKITDALDNALDIIGDRLKNGETFYDGRSKTTYTLPVKAKDTAIVASILFDKRQLIRGEATSRTENVSSEQKLLALKDNFEKLAKSKLINPDSDVIEVEYEEMPENEPTVLPNVPTPVGSVLRPDGETNGMGLSGSDEGTTEDQPRVQG